MAWQSGGKPLFYPAFFGLVLLILTGGGLWLWQARVQAADTGPVFTGLVQGVAVGGYDPVSYFSGTPEEGSPDITLSYRSAIWRFASADNRQAFQADPERYAPAYGGYCAWASAQGYLAKGDPQYWDIIDGRLYLNYDANIQTKWRADIPGFIKKAEKNWAGGLGSGS